MSHHFDTAIVREDPRLNLLDFYLFRGQSGTTVMAMTVNPNAGTKAPDTFHEEGLYAFRFDMNDDAHEEVTFKIRFGEAGHAEGEGPEGRHVQTLEVRRATGTDAAEGTEGEVIASGSTGRILAGDTGVRIFAGLAPDLFSANRKGADAYRDALAAGQFAPDLFHTGGNYFQDRNVTAIVIEVPTQLIGDPGATVRAWVTVSLCGHAPEVQVSRWGLPLITHFFITDPAVKDDYNRSLPSADVPRFSQIVADALSRITQLAGSTNDPGAYAHSVVERLFPTTLPYVLDSAASLSFAGFNGRAMTDNVMNVMLSLQTNTPIDQGATVARTNILDDFPYFGAPHGFCPDTGHNRGAIREKCSGIEAVRNFWEQVWQSPQNFDAIDDLVVEEFVFITGGRRIEGRKAFKKWAEDFSAAIGNLQSEIVNSFENRDGSRVASTFWVSGANNGAFGTRPDDSPIELTGIAISAVRDDGVLLSNQVERNAFEVYQRLTAC